MYGREWPGLCSSFKQFLLQLHPYWIQLSPPKTSPAFQEMREDYGEKSREESHVPRKGKEKGV